MNQIYKITNNINNKAYIGLTTQGLSRRWTEHVYRFKLGERDHKLYQAMRKHGIRNFKKEIICCAVDKDFLPNLEIEFIEKFDSFNNGYNMTCGGDVVSDETRRKLSKIFKGRKITWYDKILKSRRANPERKDPKDFVPRGSKNVNSKSYRVIFPDGKNMVFRGLRQFCRQHNLSHNLLLSTLKGTQTHHKGYVLIARFNDYHDSEYGQAAGNGAHPVACAG
jgi:hypothetical protein